MNTQHSHTPGPWTTCEVYDGEPCIRSVQEDLWIAGNFSQTPLPGGLAEAQANANLMSASPDLLRVAELLVSWLDEDEGAHKLCDEARAAILKANGGAA